MPLKTLHIGTILGFSVKKPLAFGPGGVVFSGCLFFFIFLLLLNGLRGRLVFYVIINIKKNCCNVHLLVCKMVFVYVVASAFKAHHKNITFGNIKIHLLFMWDPCIFLVKHRFMRSS